jgi:protein CpxP
MEIFDLILEVRAMRMSKGTWIAGLTGAALITVIASIPALVAESQAMMMHGGHDQAEEENQEEHYLAHLLKHAKEIGLTPEQISKLKSVQLDFKRTEARIEADTKVAKLELQALVDDDHADLTAIQAKVDQLKKSEAACLFAGIKAKRQASALLSPDQREKEHALHEHMKSGSQHGGGMGMMGQGGMMGGMMGSMGSGSHGQGGGTHGSGGAGGGQQHQH